MARILSFSYPKPAAIAGTQAAIRWAEIVEACAVRVVSMNQMAEEEDDI
jgi:hypothetical protein